MRGDFFSNFKNEATGGTGRWRIRGTFVFGGDFFLNLSLLGGKTDGISRGGGSRALWFERSGRGRRRKGSGWQVVGIGEEWGGEGR